ncbi:hypothetical protein QA599_05355 [Haloarculaceae archaeon H-GB1-1]|nr:hypothetical protein [Haloarculaceae archaeon H-GB1-1]
MTDTDVEALERRLRTVERALGDDETHTKPLSTADVADTTEFERRLDALESDLTELQAAVQAIRGYVGNVRSVNDEVADRAETALAKVEALEADRQSQAVERGSPGDGGRTRSSAPRTAIAHDDRARGPSGPTRPNAAEATDGGLDRRTATTGGQSTSDWGLDDEPESPADETSHGLLARVRDLL